MFSKIVEYKEGQVLTNPPSCSGNTHKKLIELLLTKNCVVPRAKNKLVGKPLEEFQLSYLGSGFVQILISKGTPHKISVIIFRSLITSYFGHTFRLLPI